MYLSKLVGERSKQTPSGAIVKNHIMLLRAGYIKQVASGIYTLLMPARKSVLKIENIIRQEMDRIDGQEMLFPVTMPKELWEESGRYSSIGEEMARFTDRNNHGMVLGMTHEEASVHAVRNIVKSYEQLPAMIYQIQTKFRDEPRPRAGLIRVREFTMKDAYSFHMTQEDLEKYYNVVFDSYNRIFKRIGMKNFISVKSDTGMMGGKVAHEFMLLTPSGEDNLVLCDSCDYKANQEVADCVLDKVDGVAGDLTLVETPTQKTIEEVCSFLKASPNTSCKAVCYAVKGDNSRSVVVFIRGDLEVNEIKLSKIVKAEVVPNDLENSKLVAGFIGPYGIELDDGAQVVYDKSLEGMKGLICGANKHGYHYTGLDMSRDIKNAEFYDVANVQEGMICPICGKGHLKLSKGVEIGNIFQLGTKYTKSMGMTVHDSEGNEINPIMGCYGIGVGRALGSVLEEWSDEKGLVFPMSIAPWQVVLCPLRLNDENVLSVTNSIYGELQNAGVEVLYDDRDISAGAKFAESELMGMPIRLVISPRSLEGGQVELSIRRTGEKQMIDISNVVEVVKNIIKDELADLNS